MGGHIDDSDHHISNKVHFEKLYLVSRLAADSGLEPFAPKLWLLHFNFTLVDPIWGCRWWMDCKW